MSMMMGKPGMIKFIIGILIFAIGTTALSFIQQGPTYYVGYVLIIMNLFVTLFS